MAEPMDIDHDDDAAVREEDPWTTMSWLEKQKKLDAEEYVGHAAWIAPTRKEAIARRKKAAEEKRARNAADSSEVSLEVSGETSIEVFEPPATKASASMLVMMPGAELGHILFRCSLLDILALRATCRAMNSRLSGVHLHQLDLRIEGAVLVSAFTAVKAAHAAGDITLLEDIALPIADLIMVLGQDASWGYFNYGKFFARSARYDNVPTTLCRGTDKPVAYSIYKVGAASKRADYWLPDDESQKKIVKLAKARFSTGTFCMGCLTQIQFGRAIPNAWSEHAVLPTKSICIMCAFVYRMFPPAHKIFGTVVASLPASVYSLGADMVGGVLPCPDEHCEGVIHGIHELAYRTKKGVSTGTSLGLLWCTDKKHTGYIHTYTWYQTVHVCTQEFNHWQSGNDTREFPDIKKLFDRSAYSRDFIVKATGRHFNTWSVLPPSERKKKKRRVVVVADE